MTYSPYNSPIDCPSSTLLRQVAMVYLRISDRTILDLGKEFAKCPVWLGPITLQSGVNVLMFECLGLLLTGELTALRSLLLK